jgi:hypothetical protein
MSRTLVPSADEADEETADEIETLKPSADVRFKSKKFRTVLGLLCVIAVVAGGVEAIRRNAPAQEKSSAGSVGESLDLWAWNPGQYCIDHNGMGPVKTKCCAKACGPFCGAANCQDSPVGHAACCFSSPTKVADCSSTQKAPCMIPPVAQQGPTTAMFGAMSFTTEADEGVVRAGAAKGLSDYFSLPTTHMDVDVQGGSRRLQSVVTDHAMWSLEFKLKVPAQLMADVQAKANAVFDDASAIQLSFKSALSAPVKLVSFTTPKTTTTTPAPVAASPATTTPPAR